MLNITELAALGKRPEYGATGASLWTDPWIAKQMLAAHLDPEIDAASRTPQVIDASVEQIMKVIEPEPGQELLDLGCGPGLWCSRFHQRGLEVTGVDMSANSLAWARDEAVRVGMDIRYICSDYLKLEMEEQVDIITLIYYDLGALLPNARDLVLDKIAELLKPGGHLVFDVLSVQEKRREAESWELAPGAGFWRPQAHLTLSAAYHYPKQNAWLDQHVVLEESGAATVYRTWDHLYTLEKIEELLANRGLEVCWAGEDLTGTPLKADSPSLAIIAKK